MQVGLSPTNVAEYYLVLNNKPEVFLNNFIGKTICLELTGLIKCIYCQKHTKKSYSNGYCYTCAIKLARCDICVLQPKNCHYHLGTCREPEWGEQHCFIPHIVYLANSSGIKVGIARLNNLPNRWIDQGAIQGLSIIKTNSRYHAGLIEELLAKTVPDKTNWRKMLANDVESIDLIEYKNLLLKQFKNFDFEFEILNNKIIDINYPKIAEHYNINLNNLSKNNIISGRLLAIKGQYLILSEGVLNIRSLTGYEARFN